MTNHNMSLDRRKLLRTTGAGILGATALSGSAGAQTSGGDEIWRFETGDSVQSSPTVIDGTVFVGSDDNNVYALDVGDGTELWSFETSFNIRPSPTVVGDTVFVGSWNGNLYGLNAGDGSERWSFEAASTIDSSPTVADGTVLFGTVDNDSPNYVYALDTTDGTEQWRFELGDDIRSSPTVVDGTVFIGSRDNTAYALDATDGTEQWSFETSDRITSSPTVADGTVFVGSWDSNIYALDVEDGTELWSFETDGAVGSSPTVADSTVFVGSYVSNVYALDAEDGTELWSFETDGGVSSSPTVADGAVFVGAHDNVQEDTNVYALDSSDGTKLWSFETGDEVWSSPTVVDGTVFVGSDDNSVYALDAGVEGSSEGSRVNLGTLGHHHVWADKVSGAVGFDPAVHGFNFPNWGGQNTGDSLEDFDPPHDHQTIAEAQFDTQFDEEWAPQIKDILDIPIAPSPLVQMGQAIYSTFQEGPETIYSDGHCYGMCLTARQFFEEGIPESLPEDTEFASDIPQPSGDYDDVGAQIDEDHRSQFLSWSTTEEALFLSPFLESSLQRIDAENEVDLIRSEIDERGTAMVMITTSPKTVDSDEERAHQVLAYNVELDGESLSDADTANIDIYDPNLSAETYDDVTSILQIDVSEPTFHPVQNQGRDGYLGFYQRFALAGPSRPDGLGAVRMTSKLILDMLTRYVDGYMSVVARSPIRIDAIAPDGTTLSRPAEDVDGTPPSEIVYLTGADAGRYDIRAEGTGDGEYGIEVAGQTPEGGRIDDSIEGEITEGETQTVAATVPESEDDEGKASADEPTLFDYTNNNDVVDTANLREAINEWQNDEAETKLLRDVIDAWRSGDPIA